MGVGRVLAFAILGSEIRTSLSMVGERNRKYREAGQAAQARGKPLLVVGGPYGSGIGGQIFHFKAHGCGDVCLDLNADSCDGCPTTVADVREIPFGDAYFGAVYVSHVLEHLPTVEDAAQAVNELYRVADEVFVVSPPKSSIYAWLYPGHHLWVSQDAHGILIEPWPA